MAATNAEIAAVFEEIAALLSAQGGSAGPVRAYRSAARTLSNAGRGVAAMVAAGEDLSPLLRIGCDLAAKMVEINTTGSCRRLAQPREEVPRGFIQLAQLPGLGPRRAQVLCRSLQVQTLEEVQAAAEAGRIRGLRQFGAVAEQRILAAVRARLRRDRRFPLADALRQATPLLEALRSVPGVERAELAGSARLMRDTVGNLDLLVGAPAGTGVMQRFLAWHAIAQVLAKGPTRASVVLRDGLQVDLRVVRPPSFGAGWICFTGSQAHNTALRTLAKSRGLKLDEYGLHNAGQQVAGATEESVYRALGLRLIEPELREQRGELEAAAHHTLPQLVCRGDIRGDLHVHTEDSEGTGSLRAWADAARARGLRYLAVTDRYRQPGTGRGLDACGLARQMDRIDALNETLEGVTLLKGVEADILEDGSLAVPQDLLGRLDVVIGAVHDPYQLSRTQQTARLQRAMDQRSLSILAHPTGRWIGGRGGLDLDLDLDVLLRQAAQRRCFVELNAHPHRLDLDDRACRMAQQAGVLVSLASAARAPSELAQIEFGLGQARRGWLRPGDLLNTRPLDELRALLAAATGRRQPEAALA